MVKAKSEIAHLVLWLGLLDARKCVNLLLATKGHPKRQSNKVHQFIISPVEQHSKKPDKAREKIIDLMGDLPRIELFARQHTPGWDVWGNEIKSDIRFAGKEV